jgi:predicted regulator of Ras-like GTPase activity (Roadblock/LC7/MglB family)
MKEILVELKASMHGIIGSFVVGEDGEVIAKDVPDLMDGHVNKMSKTLQHVISIIQTTRSVHQLTVDSARVKLISLPSNGRTLTVIAEQNINWPLFNLMSDMAITKIRAAPEAPAVPIAPTFDVGKVCQLYDQLYGAAAKRLANIIGPKSASHFKEGAEAVKMSYPHLFGLLSFDSFGKPDMIKIQESASSIPTKDELIEALDKLLLSMLDTVKKVAGEKQEQKAYYEIQQIKREHGKF